MPYYTGILTSVVGQDTINIYPCDLCSAGKLISNRTQGFRVVFFCFFPNKLKQTQSGTLNTYRPMLPFSFCSMFTAYTLGLGF